MAEGLAEECNGSCGSEVPDLAELIRHADRVLGIGKAAAYPAIEVLVWWEDGLHDASKRACRDAATEAALDARTVWNNLKVARSAWSAHSQHHRSLSADGVALVRGLARLPEAPFLAVLGELGLTVGAGEHELKVVVAKLPEDRVQQLLRSAGEELADRTPLSQSKVTPTATSVRGIGSPAIVSAIGGALGGMLVVALMAAMPRSWGLPSFETALSEGTRGALLGGAAGGASMCAASSSVHGASSLMQRGVRAGCMSILGGTILWLSHVISTRDGFDPRANPEWIAVALAGALASGWFVFWVDFRKVADLGRALFLGSLVPGLLTALAYASVGLVTAAGSPLEDLHWYSYRGPLVALATTTYTAVIVLVLWWEEGRTRLS